MLFDGKSRQLHEFFREKREKYLIVLQFTALQLGISSIDFTNFLEKPA